MPFIHGFLLGNDVRIDTIKPPPHRGLELSTRCCFKMLAYFTNLPIQWHTHWHVGMNAHSTLYLEGLQLTLQTPYFISLVHGLTP